MNEHCPIQSVAMHGEACSCSLCSSDQQLLLQPYQQVARMIRFRLAIPNRESQRQSGSTGLALTMLNLKHKEAHKLAANLADFVFSAVWSAANSGAVCLQTPEK